MAGIRLCAYLLLSAAILAAYAQDVDNVRNPMILGAIEPEIDIAGVVDRALEEIAKEPKLPLIIAVGDSITGFGSLEGGWLQRLGAAVGPTMTVINDGIGMGTSGSGRESSRQILRGMPKNETSRVKLVTLCYGANDASTRPHNETFRAIQPNWYKANLITTIKIWRDAGVQNILLITPPPASPARPDRRLEVTAEYAQLMFEVGAELHVPVADLFSRIRAIPNWTTEAMWKDGLHLNELGQSTMFDEVWQKIKQNALL